MAHGIAQINGQDSIAYLASGGSPWHKLGQAQQDGESMESWRARSNLNFEAILVQSYSDLTKLGLVGDTMRLAPNAMHVVRNDNGLLIGHGMTEGFVPHQPAQFCDTFQNIIAHDSRFAMDAMGCLAGGSKIWLTAKFTESVMIGGQRHIPRLMATTAFNGTSASIWKAVDEKVVCANTLAIALGENNADYRVKHNTKFDGGRARKALETIALSIGKYEAMGNALAAMPMPDTAVSRLFKAILEIPFDAKQDNISTRKQNQFADLSRAYTTTANEGTERGTAWCALNAVTRYVDHDKTSRDTGNGALESRFVSSQFGSGAAMKAHAISLLTEEDKFKELLANTAFLPHNDSDITAALRAPLLTRA